MKLKPTRCDQCGKPTVLVDDVTYNADNLAPIRELPPIMIVHGCVAPSHDIPDVEGEPCYLDELDLAEPAPGLIRQVST